LEQKIDQILRGGRGVEPAIGAEPQNMGDILVKLGCSYKRVSIRRIQYVGTDQIAKNLAGILAQYVRVFGPVNNLQELRNEFDIDEAAAIVACMPHIARPLLFLDPRPHLSYVTGGFSPIPRRPQNVTNLHSQTLTKIERSRNGTRAGQRKMFPGPCVIPLIGKKPIETDGNWP
jgi:hypothetical protein